MLPLLGSRRRGWPGERSGVWNQRAGAGSCLCPAPAGLSSTAGPEALRVKASASVWEASMALPPWAVWGRGAQPGVAAEPWPPAQLCLMPGRALGGHGAHSEPAGLQRQPREHSHRHKGQVWGSDPEPTGSQPPRPLGWPVALNGAALGSAGVSEPGTACLWTQRPGCSFLGLDGAHANGLWSPEQSAGSQAL